MCVCVHVCNFVCVGGVESKRLQAVQNIFTSANGWLAPLLPRIIFRVKRFQVCSRNQPTPAAKTLLRVCLNEEIESVHRICREYSSVIG